MSGILGELLDVWYTGGATGCLAYWGSSWMSGMLGQLLDVWHTCLLLDVWHIGAATGCLAYWGSYWMSGILGQLLDVRYAHCSLCSILNHDSHGLVAGRREAVSTTRTQRRC